MKTTIIKSSLYVIVIALLMPGCTGTANISKLQKDDTLVSRGSDGDMADGIRLLLTESARRATSDLSRPNGYLRRDDTRVVLPEALVQPAALLRAYGYGRLADAVLADIHRGLESTARQSMPALEAAIAQLEIRDIPAVMRGESAATQLLCTQGREALVREYATALNFGLTEAGYYSSLKILVDRYNSIPVLSDITSPELEPELRERGVNGICLRMAEEEANMRANPEARPNATIQRLFARPY